MTHHHARALLDPGERYLRALNPVAQRASSHHPIHMEVDACHAFNDVVAHFRGFGFLTHATSRGFIRHVVRPNILDIPQ